MHTTRKRMFLWLVGVACVMGFAAATAVYAQSIDFPSGFAGFSSQDIKSTIENIVRIVLGFVGVIFLLLILYAGFRWMTSGGEERTITQAKKIIVSSVIGLVVTLSAYAIASFVIRSFGDAVSNGGPGGSGGGPGGFGFALGAGVLEGHYPGRNATGIARNTNIFVTFKEPINPDTFCDLGTGKVRITSVQIKDAQDLVNPDGLDNDPDDNTLDDVFCSTLDNLTFKLDPNDANGMLGISNGDSLYRVVLTDLIMTAAATPRSALPLQYSWQFTVSNVIDTTPPTVTSVYPDPVSGIASRNAIVQINFSEPVDPSTASGLTSATPAYDKITLKDAGLIIQGSYRAGNQYRTTEFIANSLCGQNSCGGDVYCLPGPVAPATALTINGEVTVAVTDMAGNPLDQDPNTAGAQPYQWDFDTSGTIDLTSPRMLSRSPVSGQTAAPLSDPVSMCFDERISASSLKSSNVFFNQAGTALEPQINFWVSKADQDCDTNPATNNTEVLLNHDAYQPIRRYNPVVNSGVTDLQQNCYYWAPAMTTGTGQCGGPGGPC